MHTDLMRTTGFQAQAQARMDAEMFHNPVVGHRRFAHRMHRHMGTFCRMTTDRLFHCATGSHVADGHRFILASDLAQLQRLHQPGLCRNGFLHHHQTGGVLIQTVHDPRARHIGDRRIVVQQRIQHSTVRVARARMHNQIARFVNHEDVIIFVNDIERNILRLEARLFFDFDIDSDVLSPQHFFFRLIANAAID